MSPAYLKNAPAGFVGGVSRPDECNIEPAMLIAVSTVYAQAYGIPLKYTPGGVQQFNGGAETAPAFAGVLIRGVPQIGGSTTSDTSITAAVPNPDQVQDMLVRGYVMVKCVSGTPARGGVVYVQIIASGGVAVGDFRADSDGGNSVALTATQAEWAADGKDADSVAELRVAR